MFLIPLPPNKIGTVILTISFIFSETRTGIQPSIHEELFLKKKLVVMGAVVNEEAFCLKWNDFHTSLTSTFTELRAESDLLDATIFCEGKEIR